MPSLSSESGVVQYPLIKYATEVGWEQVSQEDALLLRKGVTSPIFWDVFVERIQALNPNIVDHNKAEDIAKQLVRVPPNIEGNLNAWEYLRGLKTVFVEAEKQERNLHLLDFENIKRNRFQVTDEFSFHNGVHTIRADVVFLVNGIPIILVETKAATKVEGIAEALEQVQRYHAEGPELLALMQLFNLTHLSGFYYGAVWNYAAKNLFNWKEETAAGDFETLVKTFVHPERILRLIKDFILFVRKDEELSKVILRPHQMRAVERVLVRCKDPVKRRGLVWHTQGSGKTYTMITIAKKLIEDPTFENPTVLMLVDRNELETQLFGNLASTVGIGAVEVARNKKHLRELLQSDRRGLIVSMIHKFDDVPPNLNLRENIFVLVDEAHRTTGGDLGNYLMGALPNATYLGFTGTPIDKTAYGKGTFKVFGIDDQPQGYLDKYSIAESIEDGTTVPLYYTLAPNDLQVDRETLNREFLELADAEGVSDIEDLNKVLERAVNLRNMLKNRERVRKVAQYVATHYRETVEPMGYKAFLVGVDREACCLLKEALDEYLPTEYSKVVISAFHNDPQEMKRYHLSEAEEKRIRKEFLKPEAVPKILIITEKLLTGYDAPILYCMYLDKPMRDHVLLQAIARVNRPYQDEDGVRKPGGFVLDFVGVFENLEKALAFDSKDVRSVVEGLDVLKRRFAEMVEEVREKIIPLAVGSTLDKAAEAVLDYYKDEEKRQEFYRFYAELEDLYEIISPDVFLREYIQDYFKVSDIYALLRAAYEAGKPIEKELAKKTVRLVQEHAKTGNISDAIEVYEITPETLKIIADSKAPDSVKVFNLLKSIAKEVESRLKTDPYLIPIGERAEKIAEAFNARQLSTEEALELLRALIEEINAAEQEKAERNISSDAFAVYWILSKTGLGEDKADGVASEINKDLEAFPHWKIDPAQSREIRKKMYFYLIDAGIEDPTEIVEQVMNVISRRWD